MGISRLLGKLSGAGGIAVNEGYGSTLIVSAQTSATGANWVDFAASPCIKLDVVNTSGATIEYRRGGTGAGFPIPTNSGRLIIGITDASQISIRRVDQSNTQVTLNGEAIS